MEILKDEAYEIYEGFITLMMVVEHHKLWPLANGHVIDEKDGVGVWDFAKEIHGKYHAAYVNAYELSKGEEDVESEDRDEEN